MTSCRDESVSLRISRKPVNRHCSLLSRESFHDDRLPPFQRQIDQANPAVIDENVVGGSASKTPKSQSYIWLISKELNVSLATDQL